MMAWLAFGVGALWTLVTRRLLAEAALAFRMWRRWRRSVYPAQVEDSVMALATTIVLLVLTGVCTGAAIGLVLLLKTSFE